mmetsp:Transcript_15596/g.23085  ORF Transcript_15596/g.23085 Transcript_15596/m.23085 type:complete len:359 (+) Transcript_15596:120-1196(+)
MSRNYAQHQHHHHMINNRPPIVVTDNDVLSGRGVNIAHHPGNERFRTLVTTRADESYCSTYSASEKRAVAEEIIRHIQSLDPPGRFLKRDGRGQVSRGLNGPWEELSERECVKKTCQALRDCNRTDRQGYAMGVAPPPDVVVVAETRAASGVSGKQHAASLAAAAAADAAAAASATLKRTREQISVSHNGRLSPSVENAAEWLKKQRREDGQPEGVTVGSDGMLTAPPLPPNPEATHSGLPPHLIYHDPSLYLPPTHHINPAAHAAAAAAAGYTHPDVLAQQQAEAAAAAAANSPEHDRLPHPSEEPPPTLGQHPEEVAAIMANHVVNETAPAPAYTHIDNISPDEVGAPGPLNITEL